jgi:hypothetical protein
MKKNPFNPWPFAIALICISAFVGATLVVVVMVQKKVELVRPDYYAQDQRHEQRMQQERRAQQQPAEIVYREDEQTITLTFPMDGVNGTVTFFRPSDLNLDREVAIAPDSSRQQVIPAGDLVPGLWRIRVEWFSDDVSYYQEKSISVP